MIKETIFEVIGFTATCDACGLSLDAPVDIDDIEVAEGYLDRRGWEITDEGKCFCRRCSRRQRKIYDGVFGQLEKIVAEWDKASRSTGKKTKNVI